jgi:hypothetical protein
MVKKKITTQTTIWQRIASIVVGVFKSVKTRTDTYLNRRPHRSFRWTRRRDYNRSLKLPGYFAFTSEVRKTLWPHRKVFLLLSLFYALLMATLVGLASQETYTTLTDTLRDTSGDVFDGNLGEVGKAGLLLLTAMTGGISQTLTDAQQVYAGIVILLTWLTTVWVLRNVLAGHKVKLRDGLYNAGAPIISTFLVSLVLIIQLLPLAVALIAYSAAAASGLLAGGVEAMLFWIAAGLLAVLSLYLVTSTFIAMIVVTIPGMYPIRALKTAGDLVVGRRVRILLRLLWLAMGIVIAWAVVMVPIILLDTWAKGVWPNLQWLPVIPVFLLAMSSVSVVWAAGYIYLLYRKVVADDADPA